MKTKPFPRLLLTAPASGSGKTLCTLALLWILREKGWAPVGYKCGPDFIDPMFHERILKLPSRNLDLFLAGKDGVLSSLGRGAAEGSFGVIEGVMGFFDGMQVSTTEGSSYDLCRETDTPAVLILPARGMSRSALPLLKGFLSEDRAKTIRGVLLNRTSLSFGKELKKAIEEECRLPVVGILPEHKEQTFEERHLGLFLPEEIPGLEERIKRTADRLSETLDLEALMAIAKTAGDVCVRERSRPSEKTIRVGVAKDEAFCFYYKENLELLEEKGAEIVPFSPLHEDRLPDVSRLIIGGGYPELHAKALSQNTSLQKEILCRTKEGMPILAECGGFLYLLQSLKDRMGTPYPMAGVLPGEAEYAGKLIRFGYVEILSAGDNPYLFEGEKIRGHEFHYYDTTEKGGACIVRKPGKNVQWMGMHRAGNVFAGFPHLYYPSFPKFVERFLC